MADRIGEQLGNYRLIGLLGRGGYADVYLGEHIYLKTQAALKVLQLQLTHEAIEDFLTEARTLVQLEHPHIVRVLECGVEEQTPFLVMSYAPGGSLRQRCPKGTRLNPQELVFYVTQIASALQYAHERKLVHRDVKPENILLGSNNEILLSDFGLVLTVQSTGSQVTKEMSGTIPYMAPEQLQGKPRPASDQYALGIIVYECLSGERPFHGTFVEVATQHMLASPPPLYGRIPGISSEVERVVFTALAKDPVQRFNSVEDFAQALQQAYHSTPSRPVALSASNPATDESLQPTFVKMPANPPVLPPLGAISSGQSIQQPTNLNTPQLAQPTYLMNPQAQSSQPTYVTPQSNQLSPSGYPGISHSDRIRSTTNPQDPSRGQRSLRRSLISLLCGILLLLVILLSFVLIPSFSQTLGFGGASPTPSPVNRATLPTQALTATPMPTTTAVSTPTTTAPSGSTTTAPSGSTTTATPTTTPVPTPTPTPGIPPAPFEVTSIDMSVNPISIQGIKCGTYLTVTYTATFHVAAHSPGGTVQFEYTVNNGRGSSQGSLTFGPGETTKTFPFTWAGNLPADHFYPEPGGAFSTSPNQVNSGTVGPAGQCS